MPKFVLVYRMPPGHTPGGPDALATWSTWFDALGDRLVSRGNPVFQRTTVGTSPNGAELGGYSIVTADDLTDAAALASHCPAVTSGGGVEVGLLTELNPS